jgi:hypothetical protein
MDISSVAYQKAIVVIAKQHHDDHVFESCVPANASGMDIGGFLFAFFVIFFLLIRSYCF